MSRRLKTRFSPDLPTRTYTGRRVRELKSTIPYADDPRAERLQRSFMEAPKEA